MSGFISLISSDRTDLSTESGSGPIQLARDRYRAARRSVADSPPHCMNVQKIVSYYTRSVKKAAKLNILFTVRRLKVHPSACAARRSSRIWPGRMWPQTSHVAGQCVPTGHGRLYMNVCIISITQTSIRPAQATHYVGD